jgi:hypothetical protein
MESIPMVSEMSLPGTPLKYGLFAQQQAAFPTRLSALYFFRPKMWQFRFHRRSPGRSSGAVHTFLSPFLPRNSRIRVRN